ncbi:MAG: hypothetical protein Q9M26_07015 [Mariprofundales bacterium]|nr:hypothetical protein [Mariprofundales bacterium]
MRRHLLLLLVSISVLVVAKITLPLWSHHPVIADAVPAAMSSVSVASGHAALVVPVVAGAPSAAVGGGLIPAAIAETSIASAAESLPEGKDADLLSSLRQRNKALDAREKTLDTRQAQLDNMEKQAVARIGELKKMEASLRDMLKQEDSIKSKKIKRLTAVYESMKPDRAAAVVVGLDLETVIKVFLRMKEKKVGKILSFLPPKNAVVISEALIKRLSNLKK